LSFPAGIALTFQDRRNSQTFSSICFERRLGKDEGEQDDDERGNEGAAVDASCFIAQTLYETDVVESFFAVVEVARPARGQRDSSLFARLHQS
jgi:hypothetical protein